MTTEATFAMNRQARTGASPGSGTADIRALAAKSHQLRSAITGYFTATSASGMRTSDRPQRNHRFHRAFWLRQKHRAALLEPDE